MEDRRFISNLSWLGCCSTTNSVEFIRQLRSELPNLVIIGKLSLHFSRELLSTQLASFRMFQWVSRLRWSTFSRMGSYFRNSVANSSWSATRFYSPHKVIFTLSRSSEVRINLALLKYPRLKIYLIVSLWSVLNMWPVSWMADILCSYLKCSSDSTTFFTKFKCSTSLWATTAFYSIKQLAASMDPSRATSSVSSFPMSKISDRILSMD